MRQSPYTAHLDVIMFWEYVLKVRTPSSRSWSIQRLLTDHPRRENQYLAFRPSQVPDANDGF